MMELRTILTGERSNTGEEKILKPCGLTLYVVQEMMRKKWKENDWKTTKEATKVENQSIIEFFD